MNSGSSAFIGSGAHSAETFWDSSWNHTSRPLCMAILPPVRFTTIMVLTGAFSQAASAFDFNGTGRPPRRPSSAVIRTELCASSMRPASESGEKPPNTIECTAPMRAQASIA